jgi:hypothetical protein
MELGMIALAALAAWGVLATALAAARDGYARVPTRTR